MEVTFWTPFQGSLINKTPQKRSLFEEPGFWYLIFHEFSAHLDTEAGEAGSWDAHPRSVAIVLELLDSAPSHDWTSSCYHPLYTDIGLQTKPNLGCGRPLLVQWHLFTLWNHVGREDGLVQKYMTWLRFSCLGKNLGFNAKKTSHFIGIIMMNFPSNHIPSSSSLLPTVQKTIFEKQTC